MRAPGKGIDPRVMIGDMSSDAISYSIDRMKLSNNIMKGLKAKYIKEGQSYHELRNAYLNNFWRVQCCGWCNLTLYWWCLC